MKYAESQEQVEKELVLLDTPYFSRDMSVLWVKKASGDTKTYELNEIVKKDEKDLKIEFLMAKIEELEKEANNESDDVSCPKCGSILEDDSKFCTNCGSEIK